MGVTDHDGPAGAVAQAKALPSAIVNSSIFQSLIETLGGGVILVDIDAEMRLLYASPGYAALLGDTFREMLEGGICILSKVHPADRAALEAAIRRCAGETELVSLIFRVQNAAGQIRWLRSQIVGIPDTGSSRPTVAVATLDITDLKETEMTLRQNAERLKIAFAQTSQTLWEVDIPEETFYILDSEGQIHRQDRMLAGGAQALLENGYVHPSSAETFLLFAGELLAGKAEDCTALVVRYPRTGIYGWAQLSYRTLFDEAGRPVKAIGISQEMPAIYNERTRFQQEQLLFEYLQKEQYGVAVHLLTVNLTTNRIVSGQFGEDEACGGKTDYARLMEDCRETVFAAEDRMTFRRLSPQALMDAYAKGSTWIEAEYRGQDKYGNVRWVSCVVHLLTEPASRELYAFLIKRDINERRQWELSLPVQVKRDSVSHLYTKETAERMIREILRKSSRSEASCALALVRIEGLKQLAEDSGQTVSDRVCFSIARLLRIVIGHVCVIGQQSSDQLLLFWPAAPPAARLKRELEATIDTLQRLRDAAKMPEPLTFLAGLAVEPYRRADFDELYNRAFYLCHLRQDTLRDQVILPQDTKRAAPFAQVTSEPSLTCCSEEEGTRLFTAAEQGLILSCLVKLLSAEDYRAAAADILQELGVHYDAQRVYQMMYSGDRSVLELCCEWSMEGSRFAAPRLFSAAVAEMPAVQAAVKRRKPILLKGEEPAYHQLICTPLYENERLRGFVCVDNPNQNCESTAVLSVLIPAMQMERERRDGNRQVFLKETRDRLTGLLHPDAYHYRVDTMDAEAMASMGVLYLEIERLEQLNQSRGWEYGTALMLFASELLSSRFPDALVFRASGNHFAVLFPDVTAQAFTERCEDIRLTLNEKHPDIYSMGHTWSDKDFTVKKLLRHAEEIKKYNQYNGQDGPHVAPAGEAGALGQWKALVQAGACEVYIQPKNRLSTGEVAGGEALLRCRDFEGGMITPLELIHAMEAEHVVQELDFYVLERTLGIMQGWKLRGIGLIPISINFSRQTLLNRRALSMVKEICGRFDVPVDLIEIEITETLGAMERETVSAAVEAFRKEGFRFSLDDFGSEYSSITLLAYIPFHTVKLDKSLIGYFLTNPIGRSIVESMVKICRDMGAVCIAEGVETQEQADELARAGCDYAQGYLYNKPLPAGEFEQRYLSLQQA